jgi:hypothetical protein
MRNVRSNVSTADKVEYFFTRWPLAELTLEPWSYDGRCWLMRLPVAGRAEVMGADWRRGDEAADVHFLTSAGWLLLAFVQHITRNV